MFPPVLLRLGESHGVYRQQPTCRSGRTMETGGLRENGSATVRACRVIVMGEFQFLTLPATVAPRDRASDRRCTRSSSSTAWWTSGIRPGEIRSSKFGRQRPFKGTAGTGPPGGKSRWGHQAMNQGSPSVLTLPGRTDGSVDRIAVDLPLSRRTRHPLVSGPKMGRSR